MNMPSLELCLQKPQVFYHNQVMLLAVVQQLKKDLDNIEFSPNSDFQHLDYQNISKALYAVIDYLFDKNPERLLQFFYRVDLPENQFKAILAERSENLVNMLTQMVLTRIWQKVIVRMFYSGQLPSLIEEL